MQPHPLANIFWVKLIKFEQNYNADSQTKFRQLERIFYQLARCA